MKNEAPPIEVEELHKGFNGAKVLDGLSLTVKSGSTMAVLGRSGTGKSVLLKLLIGLARPDSGRVSIHGKDITRLGHAELNEMRKRMGFLFQQSALYDALTVEENVAFPLLRHARISEAERTGKARELLAGVGLDKDLGKLPSEISGGMQKRVGLARALALEPDILLFDEPTAGLDPITGAEIGRLIRQLRERRKLTAVVVTHDIPVARMFADRFAMIHEGKLVFEGTFAELRRSGNEMIERFLQQAEVT
jgi:phospholipid/cholesterol/gamma-HCH transport system ATP-binding protein